MRTSFHSTVKILMRAQHTHPPSIASVDKRVGVAKGTKQQWVPELDVPVHIESQIKAALQPLVVLEDKLSGGRLAVSIRPISMEEAISRICQTYEELQQQGFAGSDIENAISSLVLQANFHKNKAQLPVVTLTPVLDWLLYYLDRNKLPPLYAGQVHARGGEAGVEHVRRPVQQELMVRHETVDDLVEAGALATAAVEDMPSVAPKDNDGEKEEEEAKRAHKAWLLQRLADSSSSDSCSDDSDHEPDRDSDLELDMWGADPSEIQRQKIIKARQSLSRDDRIRLISEEMFQAKDCATRAKSEGDKNAQKEYGRLIGELRKEMASLGLSEADLVPTTVSNTAALSNSKSHSPRGGKDLSNQENEEREDSIPFSALFGDDGNAEGGVLDFAETVEERAAKRRMKKLEAAGFLSKITTNGEKVVKAPFPGSAASRASCSSKMQYYEKGGGLMPKAALQKFCQSQGWPAPTYVRLPFAPSTEANGGYYRYTLNVKKVGYTKAALSRFTLPESLDGWSSSEDAQNAVATLALVMLSPRSSREMWKEFKDPLFAELWLTLEEGTSNHGKDGQDAEMAQRDSFARNVLDGFTSLEKLDSRRPDVRPVQGVEYRSAEKVTITQSTQSTPSQGLNKQPNVNQSIKARHEDASLVLAQKRKRRKGKQDLPVTAIRGELLEALALGDVAVVTGDTGSGKTTQIPQFILEDYEERMETCHIICTQPRRIAAISVAERVAQEREEPPPGKPGSTVGYAVRLDTAMTGDTKLLFCTTGILLRRMASDHGLSNITHVIVDEVHERTVQGDFLMALLRDLVLVRRQAGHPLKIILMSATLDSAKLSEYFGSCPTLHAKGRTFPVQQLFLEDIYEWLGDSYVLASDSPAALKGWGAKSRQYLQSTAVRSKHKAMVAGGWGDEADGASGEGFEVLNPYVKEMNAKDPDVLGSYSLGTRRNLARVNDEIIDFDLLEALVGYIHETQDPGAVLVFLPGMGEIVRALGRFESNKRLDDCWFVALHSSISSAEQQKAFQSPPRGFSRKIVLSTNIAETSLTIEDIVYVVDSGKVKERRYDAKRAMSLLVETWVSVASAKQRRGRAGRVRPGICYSLYPQYLISSGRMKAFQVPEVARVPLEELVLQIHYLGVSHQSPSVGGAVAFTSRLLQPPPVKSVEGAVRALEEIGALEIDMHSGNGIEKLTALGNLLARLPLDVRLGKLLILGACLRCLSPALSIAACASVGGGSPFDSGRLQQQQNHQQQQHQHWSDHLDMAAAVDGWLSAWRKGERGIAEAYVRKQGLRQEVLEMVADVRKQFAILLEDAGVIESRTACDDPNSIFNVHARSHAVVKCAIVGAMAPQVVSRGVVGVSDTGETLNYWHDGFGPVAPHPSSSCAKLVSKTNERMYPFVAYQEKVLQGKGKGSGRSIKPTGGHAHLRDCTAVGAAALVVAGGGELVIDYETGRLEVQYASNRLAVRASARSGVMVARLREGLDLALESIVNKQLRWKETAEKIVDVITAWLKEEDNSQRMLYSKAVT
jgi:ATP-dependent RNA helicase DHX29